MLASVERNAACIRFLLRDAAGSRGIIQSCAVCVVKAWLTFERCSVLLGTRCQEQFLLLSWLHPSAHCGLILFAT
jgi:hypothetical protein